MLGLMSAKHIGTLVRLLGTLVRLREMRGRIVETHDTNQRPNRRLR